LYVLYAVSPFVATGYWPFGLIVCNVWQISDVIMCTSSIMHMCTISMDRYSGIRDPLRRRVERRAPVSVRIGAVWLVSIAIGSPLVALGALRPEHVLSSDLQCAIFNEYFLVYGSVVAFFGPLGVMFVTFALTIRLLRRQGEQLTIRNLTDEGGGGMRRCKPQRHRRTRYKYDAGKPWTLQSFQTMTNSASKTVAEPNCNRKSNRTGSIVDRFEQRCRQSLFRETGGSVQRQPSQRGDQSSSTAVDEELLELSRMSTMPTAVANVTSSTIHETQLLQTLKLITTTSASTWTLSSMESTNSSTVQQIQLSAWNQTTPTTSIPDVSSHDDTASLLRSRLNDAPERIQQTDTCACDGPRNSEERNAAAMKCSKPLNDESRESDATCCRRVRDDDDDAPDGDQQQERIERGTESLSVVQTPAGAARLSMKRRSFSMQEPALCSLLAADDQATTGDSQPLTPSSKASQSKNRRQRLTAKVSVGSGNGSGSVIGRSVAATRMKLRRFASFVLRRSNSASTAEPHGGRLADVATRRRDAIALTMYRFRGEDDENIGSTGDDSDSVSSESDSDWPWHNRSIGSGVSELSRLTGLESQKIDGSGDCHADITPDQDVGTASDVRLTTRNNSMGTAMVVSDGVQFTSTVDDTQASDVLGHDIEPSDLQTVSRSFGLNSSILRLVDAPIVSEKAGLSPATAPMSSSEHKMASNSLPKIIAPALSKQSNVGVTRWASTSRINRCSPSSSTRMRSLKNSVLDNCGSASTRASSLPSIVSGSLSSEVQQLGNNYNVRRLPLLILSTECTETASPVRHRSVCDSVDAVASPGGRVSVNLDQTRHHHVVAEVSPIDATATICQKRSTVQAVDGQCRVRPAASYAEVNSNSATGNCISADCADQLPTDASIASSSVGQNATKLTECDLVEKQVVSTKVEQSRRAATLELTDACCDNRNPQNNGGLRIELWFNVNRTSDGVHQDNADDRSLRSLTTSMESFENLDAGASLTYGRSPLREREDNRFRSWTVASEPVITGNAGNVTAAEVDSCRGRRATAETATASDTSIGPFATARVLSTESDVLKTNFDDVHDESKSTAIGRIQFKSLVKKHGAAFQVAGILQATRANQQKKVFNSVKTERKAVRVLGTMFAIFFACWTPFFTANLVMGLCRNCHINGLLFKVKCCTFVCLSVA